MIEFVDELSQMVILPEISSLEWSSLVGGGQLFNKYNECGAIDHRCDYAGWRTLVKLAGVAPGAARQTVLTGKSSDYFADTLYRVLNVKGKAEKAQTLIKTIMKMFLEIFRARINQSDFFTTVFLAIAV